MGQVVYLSGPMSGKTFDDAHGWRVNVSSDLVAYGYTVLSPTAREQNKHVNSEGVLGPTSGFKNETEARELVSRDEWDVRTADIILVNLEELDKVSIGTVAELSWAYILRKHVVLALPPNKRSVHSHPFVKHQASVRFSSLLKAVDYLMDLAVSSGQVEKRHDASP